MLWTDERIEDLKIQWAEGKSASQIGEQYGCSRNAVVGKCHRLGLKSPYKRGMRTGLPKPKRTAKFRPRQPEPEPDEFSDLPIDQSPFACSIADVEEYQCRWPLNDAGRDFRFCGAIKTRGAYCGRHARIAYWNPPVISEHERERRHFQAIKNHVGYPHASLTTQKVAI